MGTRAIPAPAASAGPEPTVADLLGIEQGGAVPVDVRGPARVQELPCEDGSTYSRTVGTDGARMAAEDYRRRSVTLVSRDDDIWVGRAIGDVQQQAASASWWPKGVPLTMHVRWPIWVAADSADTLVSIIAESWTE